MLNIAIDGPAGAGKSSVAKELSKKLNISHMDTGALYRAVTYYFIKKGALKDRYIVFDENLKYDFLNVKYFDGVQNIFLYDYNVTDKIRTIEISKFSSYISSIPRVRKYILKIERDFAKRHDVIMDGRDIGTVVLPNANLKIFLTASLEVRAKRRAQELAVKGEQIDFRLILKNIKIRDKKDRCRKIAPLRAARDYVVVDSTNFSVDQIVESLYSLVKKIYVRG